jgi:hypothetical protein
MMMITTYFIFCLFMVQTPLIHSALPPGYGDDHTMCISKSACLLHVSHQHGWSGARVATVECCDVESGAVSRPVGWGWRLGYKFLFELWNKGFKSTQLYCTDAQAIICNRGEKLHKKRCVELDLEEAVNRLAAMYV